MVVDTLSLTLFALADPTRRSILDRLADGPATVGELAKPFRISQQAVSKHLVVLERAHLVEKRREGRRQVCSLHAEPMAEVSELLEQYRRFWDASFERLDALLAELQRKETGRRE